MVDAGLFSFVSKSTAREHEGSLSIKRKLVEEHGSSCEKRPKRPKRSKHCAVSQSISSSIRRQAPCEGPRNIDSMKTLLAAAEQSDLSRPILSERAPPQSASEMEDDAQHYSPPVDGASNLIPNEYPIYSNGPWENLPPQLSRRFTLLRRVMIYHSK
jgi:hypothetical protein